MGAWLAGAIRICYSTVAPASVSNSGGCLFSLLNVAMLVALEDHKR
jgi:hypothetical protein